MQNNQIDLRAELENMTSERLSGLLQTETAKEVPNDDLVLLILDILEKREKDKPVELGPKSAEAWERYQTKARKRGKGNWLHWKPLLQVASVVLVIVLLFGVIPQQAEADSWWDRLAKWTDDFFSYFNSDADELPQEEYVFQTDNPGLQQIYDAVVEMGVTEPVVPMWLPEGYELVEINSFSMPTHDYVVAILSSGNDNAVIQISVLRTDKPTSYFKDESEITKIERYGVDFSIMNNQERLTAVWTVDNLECSIFIDCQEDTLYEIIESIYRWR